MKSLPIPIILAAIALLSSCKDQPNDQTASSGQDTAAVSQLNLKFLVPDTPLDIARDYNQRASVEIRNQGSETARIRLNAEGKG